MIVGLGNLHSQSTDRNYVYQRTFQDENGTKSLDVIHYFDGLGRSVQTVQRGITPTGSDLVDYMEYDLYGRESNRWLPVAIPGNGGAYADLNKVKANTDMLYPADLYPYAKSEYEASPLNRVLKQIGAGQPWHTNSKAKETRFLINGANITGADKKLVCSYYQVVESVKLKKTKDFDAGELSVTETKDEDGNLSYEFKNKEGQVILIRQVESGINLDTYYVYDDFGNLCFVLPPLASDALTSLGTVWSETTLALKNYAYLYQYDGLNRCIAKKIPGAEWIYYVYDKANRVIYTQDGEQRVKGEWQFSIPDAFGRVVLTGLCKNSLSYASDPLSGIVVKAVWAKVTNTYMGYTITPITLESPIILTAKYYDRYEFIGLNNVPNTTDFNYETNSTYGTRYTGGYKGFQTGSITALLDGSGGYLYSSFYYDNRERVIQTKQTNHLTGGIEKEFIAYNFVGQPTKKLHIHSATGKTTQSELFVYTYDQAGRLTETTHQLNGGTTVSLAKNTYDELGRLKTNMKGNNTNLTSTYSYNIRSWIKSISSPLFQQTLYYNDTYGGGSSRYNGNISAMNWLVTGDKTRGYTFAYDGLSRITSANYLENGSASNNYKVPSITYDKHGNIKSLERWGKTSSGSTFAAVDVLTMEHDGNQLKTVAETGTNVLISESYDFKSYKDSIAEYLYNANGSMTKDLNKGITEIKYNQLNLPSLMDIKSPVGEARNTYTYTADGIKRKTLQQWNSNYSTTPVIGTGINVSSLNLSKTTDYAGNIIYENGSLKRILIDGGYIEGGVYYFYLTDHLGNNRVVANSSGAVIQKTHYYPFGMAFAESTDQGKQPYKYNGKEFDQMHGLNLYDYSARYMEPALGRFTTVDPLAEKYYSVSPYVYCNNNPLSLTDPTGMSPEDEKAGQSIFGSIAQSIKNLFSISIDATSSKTIQESKQQIEANGQLIEQTTKNVNAASDALSLVIPFSSGVDVVANSAAGNKEAALAALPLVVLDIATAGKGKAAKVGISVLGHYPEYVNLANKLGAKTFQVPVNVWNKMSPKEQWTANTKFLDRMILRGDNIRLATPLNRVKPGSFFQKELNYLFDKGYKVNSTGSQLIK